MLSSLELREYLSATLIAKGSGSACLFLQPITPLLGICNTLLLLTMNRHCAKKSSSAGFAGDFVALIVYQNSALGCATGSNQDNAKKNYSAHRFAYLFVAVGGRGAKPLPKQLKCLAFLDRSLERSAVFLDRALYGAPGLG
jgi:hypothetical protein